MIMVRAIAAALLFCGLASTAEAQTATSTATPAVVDTTPVLSGDHTAFGRITVDANAPSRFQLDRDGDHVTVRFTTPIKLGAPPPPPRNVIEIKTSGAVAELTLVPGATIYPARIGTRIVFDVFGPPGATRPAPLSAKRADPPPASGPPQGPTLAQTPPATSAQLTPSQPEQPPPEAKVAPVLTADRVEVVNTPLISSEPLPSSIPDPVPLGRDVLPENNGPIGLAARRVRLPRGVEGSAFLIPFGKTTGAAAFRSGNDVFLVFDERRPVDMAALRDDPVFHAAAIRMLAAGTLLQIPVAPRLFVSISQVPQGWRISAVPILPRSQPIVQTVEAGRLNLTAEQPSEVISMADPLTGATLLVGTQRRAGQATAIERHTPEFILRPTILGVVVEPLSDAILLRPSPTGFALVSNTGALALSPATSATAAMIDAAHLTRRLDLSLMRPEALVRRISKQFADAAVSQPGARGPKHHIAAESMIALGLGAEAESLLHTTAEQDPREAASADTAALTGIAALLAGRLNETEPLDDPRLTGTDEIALWRAVRLAMRDEGSPAAAAVFATTAPLVALYPPPVRDRVMPLAIETMLLGGELAPATRLLDQHPDDPALAYARALRLQAEGDTAKALEALDTLAVGHDQFDRMRAGVHAVELRLADGKIDKTIAADELDKLLYAWRGDDRELALRQRIADLRAQTGQWRVALSALRQAEVDFPEKSAAIHARLKDMFATMIRSQDKLAVPPLEFVAMVDENADLMPRPGDEQTVDQPLADRLLALDLPDRAQPILTKLLKSAPSDIAKARYGASLATLQAHDRNDAAALATLDASEIDNPPDDLASQRLLIRAGSMARNGDRPGAVTLLRTLGTAPAAAARAEIQEDAKDWPAAARAWSDCVALSVPDTGALDEGQTRTLVRLATAAARAGDDAGLDLLRQKYDGRVAAGSLADMFHLLTAAPIRTSKDIERSKKEVNLAASVPAGLKAMDSGAVAR